MVSFIHALYPKPFSSSNYFSLYQGPLVHLPRPKDSCVALFHCLHTTVVSLHSIASSNSSIGLSFGYPTEQVRDLQTRRVISPGSATASRYWLDYTRRSSSPSAHEDHVHPVVAYTIIINDARMANHAVFDPLRAAPRAACHQGEGHAVLIFLPTARDQEVLYLPLPQRHVPALVANVFNAMGFQVAVGYFK